MLTVTLGAAVACVVVVPVDTTDGVNVDDVAVVADVADADSGSDIVIVAIAVAADRPPDEAADMTKGCSDAGKADRLVVVNGIAWKPWKPPSGTPVTDDMRGGGGMAPDAVVDGSKAPGRG